MPRQPIHLQAIGGKPPRQALWEAIRARRNFELNDLKNDVSARLSVKTIESYVKSLVKAGFVEPISQARDDNQQGAAVYRLTKDNGVEAPRVNKSGCPVTQGAGRENMWRALRVLREFSWRDLMVHASTESHPIQSREASDYVSYLHRAGYIICTTPSRPGTPARYRFNPRRNTGPRPPQIQRGKRVYDPNLDEVVWSPEEAPHE